LYGYVLNRPLNLTDPTGQILFNLGAAGVGAAIGATVGLVRGVSADGDASEIGRAVLKGAIIGAISGGTLGGGAMLLEAAGLTGYAAFNLSLWEGTILNARSGCPSRGLGVMRNALTQETITAATTLVGGGLGRLAGDIGTGVSQGFGTFANRYFSAGIGALSAEGAGLVQATSRR